jgi:serine/threonine protein kinase
VVVLKVWRKAELSEIIPEELKAFLRGDYKKAGDIYRRKGRLDKALKMFLLAENYSAASEVEAALGHPEKAVEYLLRAGEVEGAARLLISRKNFKKAAQILADANMMQEAAKVAEEGGVYPLAAHYYELSGRYLEAGFSAYKGGMKEKAAILLVKAMRDFPLEETIPKHEVFTWREKKKEMARIFEESDVYDKAAALYESLGFVEAAARCRELAGETDKAVVLYRRLGFLEKASELLGKAENQNLVEEGARLEQEGKVQEAMDLYLKAGDKKGIARCKELLGQYAEAAQLYKECREMDKAAQLFYKSGEFQEAGSALAQIGEFQMAMQAFREGGFIYEAAAMAFEAKKWEDAVSLILTKREMIEGIINKFDTLSEETKKEARVKVALARLRLETGNLDGVTELLKNVEPDPLFVQDPWPDYLRGRVLEGLGKTKEAAACYNRVLRKNYAFQDAQKRLNAIAEKSPKSVSRYETEKTLYEGISGNWISGFDKVLNFPLLLFRARREIFSEAELKDSTTALKIILSLSHPHILTLRDILAVDKELLLVYEPFEGTPLQLLLNDGFKPSLFRAVDLLRQIVEALYEAHRKGILHGQLTQESILLEHERRAKISGFGLPIPSEVNLNERKRLMPYLAPEARRGATLSPSSDLYSAGALFASFLFGEEPPVEGYEGLSLKSIDKLKTFPAQVERLLKGLFSFSTVNRFRDASEVLQEIKPLELLPGAIIAERYEILNELGKGGMGEVFRVKDVELDEVVALKMLRVKSGMSEIARARFLREIKVARKISHENVIRVYDLGSYKDITFLTMEYIDGPTLSDWVKEGWPGSPDIREKVSILHKVAKGLEAAHLLGVIHRDLKPQNVLLTKSMSPKIVDFGIAYTEEGADLTQEGRFVGSPKYVSPEQIQGKPMDAKSDIYSFGLLSYFALTGKEAFSGRSSEEIIKAHLDTQPPSFDKELNIPERLQKLVYACLSKTPEKRPPSMRAVARVLEEFV